MTGDEARRAKAVELAIMATLGVNSRDQGRYWTIPNFSSLLTGARMIDDYLRTGKPS